MKTICWLLAALMFWAGSVSAQTLEEDGESGLKLPRFVSLRSNQINARSGPGARYPIEWVYMQKGAPVEIIAEFEIWRQIKDWQGSKTWVHKTMLSGHRSVKVMPPGENNIYSRLRLNGLPDGCRARICTACIRRKLLIRLSPDASGFFLDR